MRLGWVALVTLATSSLVAQPASPPSAAAIEKAFEDYWKAGNPGDADKAAQRLLKAGVDFDTAWSRVHDGRRYTAQKSGTQMMRLASVDGTIIDNTIEIPREYDPATRWPVRVQLHGGVMRNLPEGDEQNPSPRRRVNRIEGETALYIQPRGFAGAAWWQFNQVDNILTLIDRVKRRYNVDENRVYVTGVSDGATGAYFLAMKVPTPFSAFLPLNGNMRVLGTPGTGADGQFYAGNFVNRPFFNNNGGQDPLYTVGAVPPHVVMMERAGTLVEFRPQPAAGHDTSWWPNERANFERFAGAHPRQPYPERLTWETERADRYNRISWLVIDRLGNASSDVPLDDVNRFAPPNGGPEQPMFARNKPSGRVDVTRKGNTITARTRGVTQFTLLLSPDMIDFSQPVIVTVNDRPVFRSRLVKDVTTLMKWAARDNDRTMLFGAEVTLQVP
jgi:predicted esterase